MVVEPSKPMRDMPHGSVTSPLKSKSMVTDLVTSLMVRSPVTFRPSSPLASTAVELKVIFGNLSTSKKSEVRRWPKITFNSTAVRSEEHTSELQSRFDLVFHLLLEKKKLKTILI